MFRDDREIDKVSHHIIQLYETALLVVSVTKTEIFKEKSPKSLLIIK